MGILNKTMILILLGFCSFGLTYIARPFYSREMNILELSSNLSALLTLISGALYILNTNEALKMIFFVFMVVINSTFGYIWLESLIYILVENHLETLEKYFPKLGFKILAWKKSMEKTQCIFNLIKYFKLLKRQFLQYYLMLIFQYQHRSKKKHLKSNFKARKTKFDI